MTGRHGGDEETREGTSQSRSGSPSSRLRLGLPGRGSRVLGQVRARQVTDRAWGLSTRSLCSPEKQDPQEAVAVGRPEAEPAAGRGSALSWASLSLSRDPGRRTELSGDT